MREQRRCSLGQMLGEFVQLEHLDEFICRHCTLVKTKAHLEASLNAGRAETAPTSSKKKRLRALQKELDKVDAALREDVERDIKDVKLLKVANPATKQTMISRVRSLLCFSQLSMRLRLNC